MIGKGKPDAYARWTTYRLAVIHAFKGRPPNELKFYTTRDSGGFYMDRPWVDLPKGHDVGGEYLLFLNPIPAYAGRPVVARKAVFVNYSCGQSGPWSKIPRASRELLRRLSRST